MGDHGVPDGLVRIDFIICMLQTADSLRFHHFCSDF